MSERRTEFYPLSRFANSFGMAALVVFALSALSGVLSYTHGVRALTEW